MDRTAFEADLYRRGDPRGKPEIEVVAYDPADSIRAYQVKFHRTQTDTPVRTIRAASKQEYLKQLAEYERNYRLVRLLLLYHGLKNGKIRIGEHFCYSGNTATPNHTLQGVL